MRLTTNPLFSGHITLYKSLMDCYFCLKAVQAIENEEIKQTASLRQRKIIRMVSV